MMAKVAAQAKKEFLPQRTGTGSLDFSFPSIFISSSLLSFLTLSAFTGTDTGAKDPEPSY